ncbi:MAG: transporter substrate-binding domain-containing protein [Oscillospiraceae bacterium]|nr:transporter substrate-binding domain-containing protein [Oscillospiraceae bacterium]
MFGCRSTANSQVSSSAEAKEFRVGMECAYAPFNWTQSDNSNGAAPVEGGGYAGGYDVAVAQKIADGLGRKLVIVKTKWDGLQPAVESGTIDAIIAGMSPTAARKASIDFTDNYYKSELVIVVRKDGPYAKAASLKDFSGARITGQLNTFHYTVIDQIPGVKKQAAMSDFPTMITALNSGVIDGYVSERPGAVSAMTSNKNLTYIQFKNGTGFQASDEDIAIAVGLKKGSDLKDPINKILAGLSETERQEIMDKAVSNQPMVSK